MVDSSSAHELAPAVPGIGKHSLGPAAPETEPSLLSALRQLEACSDDTKDPDERIFDAVQAQVAPLPVLRRTLGVWRDSLSDGVLRAAADDVLLVLHPAHLCDTVSGKALREQSWEATFCPLVDRPIVTPSRSGMSVAVLGKLCADWAAARSIDTSSCAELVLDNAASWAIAQASAACVTFPAAPHGLLPIFSPPSCPLKALRQLQAWIGLVLDALRCLIDLARRGRPVLLRFPMSAESLHPLSSWLQSMAVPEGDRTIGQPCLTLEFSCVCLH